MVINWDESGYPALHYERLKAAKKFAIRSFGITGSLFLCGLCGSILGYIPPLITAFLAAVFILFGLLGAFTTFYDTARYVQVIPYFQQRLGQIDTFLAGHTIVRYLKQLDQIAENQGAAPISSFGFADDLRGEKLIWHEPSVGLQTIHVLEESLQKTNVPDVVLRMLLADLSNWKQAFQRAVAQQVPFCVLLRHGNSTSGHEWDVRKGAAF